jgi:predicted N-acyltransferase
VRILIHNTNTINQIDSGIWDDLSAGMPFQSHAWHQFGEKVLADCLPIYLLAYQNEALIGRAVFWITRNEPLPKSVGWLRMVLLPILRTYPLLICRSPIAQTSGLLISPKVDDSRDVVAALIDAALVHGRQKKCSALVLDYLSQSQEKDLPLYIRTLKSTYPGNILYNDYTDFNHFLTRCNKKVRQNYHRTLRELENIQVTIHSHKHAEHIQGLLPLIRNVERQHDALPSPWVKFLLQYMEMVDGTLLLALMHGRVIGCMLFLEDGDGQIATAFGRESDLLYVYQGLFYEGLRMAMHHKVKHLRWGSGADEFKHKIGFLPEDNGVIAFTFSQPFLRKLSSKFLHLSWS